MAAYKMAAVKVTPPNDFPFGLIRSHMVVIHLFLMLCDLQRMVRDLCPTLQNVLMLNVMVHIVTTGALDGLMIIKTGLVMPQITRACIRGQGNTVAFLLYS
jgi:hypothetical protein